MRGIIIIVAFIAVCAAQIQIMPTLMICGSPSNPSIFTQCKLWTNSNNTNDIELPARPVTSAPYCNEINFESQIVVNGTASISCSVATQLGPYQYAISMYDPTFSGKFSSNVGFPFLFEAGKTWSLHFSAYQEWINNNKNQILTGYQYQSNSWKYNHFQVTGAIFLYFGFESDTKAVPANPKPINLDKYVV